MFLLYLLDIPLNIFYFYLIMFFDIQKIFDKFFSFDIIFI